MRNIACTLLLLSFAGCFRHSGFYDDNPEIKFSDVLEIKLTRHSPGDTIDETYSLKDKILVDEFVNEIKNSKLDGPWKGAGWDKIYIINKADTVVLNSNGSVFGTKNSGTFYRFSSKDPYKKYWGIIKAQK